MPDISAGRPLPLPEKQFTEEDIRAVSSALFDIDREIEPGTRGAYDRRAAAVLEALASRSRLLPPSAEHREEEFTVEYVHPMDREYRRQRMEPCMRTLAEVVEYAAGLRTVGYVDVKLYRRTRAVDAGPWVEVDGSPA